MTPNNEVCYAAWAPDDSPWSVWAKPVLFARLDVDGTAQCSPDLAAPVLAMLPATFEQDLAIVVDLPGDDSVRAGLELARRGWRPVPLFNATNGPKALVDVTQCASMLRLGAELLPGLQLKESAPPAFLLDAARMVGVPAPGTYDNRSMVLPQDFPSATFLRSRGIRDILYVQRRVLEPADDLRHVLLRWQQAGMRLFSIAPEMEARQELHVSPPSMFRRAYYRLKALMGLRRHNVAGFGAVVPMPSAGGYG